MRDFEPTQEPQMRQLDPQVMRLTAQFEMRHGGKIARRPKRTNIGSVYPKHVTAAVSERRIRASTADLLDFEAGDVEPPVRMKREAMTRGMELELDRINKGTKEGSTIADEVGLEGVFAMLNATYGSVNRANGSENRSIAFRIPGVDLASQIPLSQAEREAMPFSPQFDTSTYFAKDGDR